MFDALVYYGIFIGLVFSAYLVVVVVLVRLLGKKDTPRMGGFPPRPPEPMEGEDDIGGSFTCYFCGTFYDIGAKECLCYGCGRHICLACTDYEESQTSGGPDGEHTPHDHPAYERHAR